jgi:hypothetical protein
LGEVLVEVDLLKLNLEVEHGEEEGLVLETTEP